MAKLTAKDVQTLTTPGYYAAGIGAPGLYLCIAKGGSKSWIYRYQMAGRRRDMGLGSVQAFTLAEARDKAAGDSGAKSPDPEQCNAQERMRDLGGATRIAN